MNFINWEDYFDERIIARDEQYFLNGTVANLVIKIIVPQLRFLEHAAIEWKLIFQAMKLQE